MFVCEVMPVHGQVPKPYVVLSGWVIFQAGCGEYGPFKPTFTLRNILQNTIRSFSTSKFPTLQFNHLDHLIIVSDRRQPSCCPGSSQ